MSVLHENMGAPSASGMDVGQLAAELGRKPRAVVSRLVKHGVVAREEA